MRMCFRAATVVALLVAASSGGQERRNPSLVVVQPGKAVKAAVKMEGVKKH